MSVAVSGDYIFVSISVVVHIFGLPIRRHQQALTAIERHQSKGNLENEPAGGLLCDFVFCSNYRKCRHCDYWKEKLYRKWSRNGPFWSSSVFANKLPGTQRWSFLASLHDFYGDFRFRKLSMNVYPESKWKKAFCGIKRVLFKTSLIGESHLIGAAFR